MAFAKTLNRSHDHLDGTRGVLVFAVLILHVFYFAERTRGQVPWYKLMTVWFQPCLYVVGLFVVLSGYCLMLSVVHNNGKRPKGGPTGFLWRRCRRIVPPYYAAIALSLLMQRLFRPQYSTLLLQQNSFHSDTIWSHLLFYYNFSPIWRNQINGVFWSLAPEWQLYLLFPSVLVSVWRNFGVTTVLTLAATFSVLAALISDQARQMHPWYLFLFVGGMAGATATASSEPQFCARRDRIPWAVISLSLSSLFLIHWFWLLAYHPEAFIPVPPLWQEYCGNEITLGLALLAAILHWNKVQATTSVEHWPFALKLLHHRAATWLGRCSYSIYLVHWPILVAVIGSLRLFRLSGAPLLLCSYLLGLPASIGFGYVFFLAIERRFIPAYALNRQTKVVVQLGLQSTPERVP